MSRIDDDARTDPRYGEVWMIEPEGGEAEELIGVVVSTDAVNVLPHRLVARIDRSRGGRKGRSIWQVEIPVGGEAGFDGRAVVDAMHLQCVPVGGCRARIGRLPAECMAEVAAAIAILVEYA